MTARMEFSLLGPLQVRSDGAVVPVDQGKQRAVLAALLLEANRVVSADRLAETLWGSQPPPSAQVTIRNHVRRLRDVLGDVGRTRISTRPRGYLINVDDGELDVAEFELLLGAAHAAARDQSWELASSVAAQALALWRGEPLVDVPAPPLLLREVPQLIEMRLQAVELRIEADLHRGNHAQVTTELDRLVAQHPLREHLHALLMLALYRSGRQADALAVYKRARTTLVEEIGAEPGSQLRELHHQILSGDTGLDSAVPAPAAQPRTPAVPRQLPCAVRHFVGRDRELAELARLVRPAGEPVPGGGVPAPLATVILAISGTAGVGKTTLAVRWAHQVAGDFPDGQLWVNLRGYDPAAAPLPATEAIRILLDALDVPPNQIPDTLDAQVGLYRSLLADRRILIVLDNARDAVQVRPLLPGAPGCLTVITSRSKLLGLAATEGVRLLDLDVLNESEARALLGVTVGRRRLRAEPAAADALVRLCAGLPLALAIAAARAQAAPLLQLSDLADQLGAAQSTLDMLDGGDPASNLRAAFACSYQRLPVEDARMFRLLGLHPGLDIGVPAAASLTAMPRRRAQNILGRLADANLVTEHLPGRYTMHDLLRSYAREQAESEEGPDCRRATADRILDHYLHTSYEAMLLISRLPPWPAPPAPEVGVVPEHITSRQSALAWFEVEHQVLLGLLATAGDYDRPRHIWRIAAALGSSLLPKDRGHEAISVLTTGLQVAEASNDRLGIAHLHLRLGRAQVGVRCFAAAEEVLDLALREFEELGDLTGQGMCHQVLSLALELQGRVGQALPHSQLALEMFRSAGAVSEEAGALNGVGWLHMRTGDHQTGLTLCQQALALNTELGFLIAQAETWDSIGYAYHHLGHHARALTCYRSALRLHRESGRMYYVAETLVHIGETHQATGDLGSARQAWREALAILTQLEHPDARAVAARLEPARATGR